MKHPLQLDDVRTFDGREGAIAEAAGRRVVDPFQLRDRLRILADLDRQADVIVAASGIVRVGDFDRRGLQIAPPPVAAFRLP